MLRRVRTGQVFYFIHSSPLYDVLSRAESFHGGRVVACEYVRPELHVLVVEECVSIGLAQSYQKYT